MTKSNIINYIIVLVIFTLTGLTSVYVSGLIMEKLNLQKWGTGYILGIIFIITPVYQALLLLYATLFGKLGYFLDKQKKLIKLIRGLF